MKTGTITFHSPNNNGSFLQAYALQKHLERYNEDVENVIINLHTEQQDRQYGVFRRVRSFGDLIRNAISLMHLKDLRNRYAQFENMRKSHLKMTERVKSSDEAKALAEKFDFIICGSDQIWNTGARDHEDAYFMEGISKPKISYAASCGSHIEQVNHKKLIDAVAEFKAVSVREAATQELLSSHGVSDVEVVVDPTLLLAKEDYAPLYSIKPLINEDYILLYTINYAPQALQNAQRLGRELGLSVYAPFTGYSCYRCKKYGIKVLYDIAPDKFLNLLANAKYVCSNSFHGVAFSVIFQKNFYRLQELSEDGEPMMDDRIDNLLNAIGLQCVNFNLKNKIEECRIDYSEVVKKQENLVEKSRSFLSSAIKKIV